MHINVTDVYKTKMEGRDSEEQPLNGDGNRDGNEDEFDNNDEMKQPEVTTEKYRGKKFLIE